jgi:hypothetical protein
MMRVMTLLAFATTLTGCSGSSRVDDLVPGWANPPSSTEAPRHAQRAKRDDPQEKSQDRTDARAVPKPPSMQSPSEE